MSTIHQKTKRADAVHQAELDACSKPVPGGWSNFFHGMASVLELFPSGEVYKPLDPEEALAIDCENVNRDLCAAFEGLVSVYEETQSHAANPQTDSPPAAGSS